MSKPDLGTEAITGIVYTVLGGCWPTVPTEADGCLSFSAKCVFQVCACAQRCVNTSDRLLHQWDPADVW